ncbi:MAG TPA: c-type cytochrome [Gammaproteobacteria bacterium]|nr:c-type cytochrome [Gammaproteobacteria bacterium]
MALAPSAHAQQHAGQYEQPDIDYGARLYRGHCITCHGERGDSIPGVSLGSNKFRRAASDRDLTTIIRDGIAGTAMAPNGYSDSELAALVAYLRNMTRADLGATNVGDAERGRALFFGKGDCGRCHRVGADGPRAAPDLSSVGVQRTAATLQRTLLDPLGALLPINRPVRAVLRDGTVVTGRRLNEDTYTVQLIDERERLHTFDKAALREYSLGNDAKMPSYATTLTDAERADLVAYLLSLKGE